MSDGSFLVVKQDMNRYLQVSGCSLGGLANKTGLPLIWLVSFNGLTTNSENFSQADQANLTRLKSFLQAELSKATPFVPRFIRQP